MGKVYRILTLNLGSTSTKVAVFDNDRKVFDGKAEHDPAVLDQFESVLDQYDYRMKTIEAELARQGVSLEGLAAGPAIARRWGKPGQELPQNHKAWIIEAGYIAQLCHNAIMNISPEKIILGGGVMGQSFLSDLVREKTMELLGGYLSSPVTENGLKDYIVTPGLGINSGVMGSWLLAVEAAQ